MLISLISFNLFALLLLSLLSLSPLYSIYTLFLSSVCQFLIFFYLLFCTSMIWIVSRGDQLSRSCSYRGCWNIGSGARACVCVRFKLTKVSKQTKAAKSSDLTTRNPLQTSVLAAHRQEGELAKNHCDYPVRFSSLTRGATHPACSDRASEFLNARSLARRAAAFDMRWRSRGSFRPRDLLFRIFFKS